ncbi:MAG: ATP-binding cassette domain-containing protein [Synergistales bacterium]|nr:ATP-binding cassette domain-containing protein [Synergistales bacterium]
MKYDTVPDIEMNSLFLSFGSKKVLDNFSLRVYPGMKVLIRGRSGAGKTSLFNCLLGFVRPQRGEIFIKGKKLSPSSIWEIRQKLAFVAQEPDLGTGKVREVIERPFSYKANRYLSGNLGKLQEMWDLFLLDTTLLEKDIRSLSGGEKQRAAIVLALLLDRPVLLLDEASSALDRDSKQAVSDYLRKCEDRTILAISHDEEWASCCDSKIDLLEGKAVSGK